MKKLIIIFSFLLLAIAFMGILPGNTSLLAISGCCMERQSVGKPWRENGKSFDECDKDNKKEGDNIFKEEGLVWWNRRC